MLDKSKVLCHLLLFFFSFCILNFTRVLYKISGDIPEEYRLSLQKYKNIFSYNLKQRFKIWVSRIVTKPCQYRYWKERGNYGISIDSVTSLFSLLRLRSLIFNTIVCKKGFPWKQRREGAENRQSIYIVM